MKILLQVLVLVWLFATVGCQTNSTSERTTRLNCWRLPASPESVVSEPDEESNSIVVSGLVNVPGLQTFETESITLRKAIAAAGDIRYEGFEKSAIFVSIERPAERGIVAHLIPSDLLNHPSIRDIQVVSSDSIRVTTFEKTSLAYSTEKLETIQLAGNVVAFVEIAVSGIGELVKVMSDNSRAPKLEKLGTAVDDYQVVRQLPPILVLSRELPSQSRREIYYLPTSSDLYGVISDRPQFLDLAAVFQKGVRLRNRDVVSYSFLQSSPIVVENLFAKLVTENESTVDENRRAVFAGRQRGNAVGMPLPRTRIR